MGKQIKIIANLLSNLLKYDDQQFRYMVRRIMRPHEGSEEEFDEGMEDEEAELMLDEYEDGQGGAGEGEHRLGPEEVAALRRESEMEGRASRREEKSGSSSSSEEEEEGGDGGGGGREGRRSQKK